MNVTLEKALTELESCDRKLLDLSKEMLSESIYPLDFLVTGALNRTLTLINGFVLLIRSNNYICAAHLVRLHLDTLLRVSAAWIVDEPHEFATKVMDGERIDKLKDRSGALMKDVYLAGQLSVNYPWVMNVYKETSGFIHLSKKHVFTASRVKNRAERTVESTISREDRFVPDEARIEATLAMIEITKCLYEYIYGWVETKKQRT